MPSISLSRRIDALRRDMDPTANVIDLGLQVQAPDGRVLVSAGGLWHRRLQKYVGPSPTPHVIRLMSSQVQAGEMLADWCRAYDANDPSRLALLFCLDMRRGGKTFFLTASILAFALKYPWSHLGRTTCWIVVPTFPQGREIHELIASLLPHAWFRDRRVIYHKSPNYYSFGNGAELWIKSADRPESLKWGGVAAVGLNEGQQVDVRAVLNAIGANVDSGGLTIIAANPPDTTRGLWMETLHEGLKAVDKAGKPLITFAAEVGFPAAKNAAIDQSGRSRFLQLAQLLNPKQAKRDALGLWVSLKDRAYPHFSRAHVQPEPAGWTDFTAETVLRTRFLRKGATRMLGAGMDFQRRPYCAWIEAKVLLAPAGASVPEGTPVYVVTAEVTNDLGAGDQWTEELLCEKVAAFLKRQGRSACDYFLVADRTGLSQGASSRQRGQGADPATYSWPIVQRYGWDPHAPIERDKMVIERGVSSTETSKLNPPVPVRLNLANELLRANRIIFTHDVPLTIESFQKAELKPGTKKLTGDFTHLPDAVSYLLYTWETALIESGVVKAPAQAE